MRARLRDEAGMGLIELLSAMAVLSIALLALMASFDTAALSLHLSAQKTIAAKLANKQLELYSALPFDSIALDETTTDNVGDSANGAYDSLYNDNAILAGDVYIDPLTDLEAQYPSGTVNDVTISGCGSSAQCLPVQSQVTGTDNHKYRIETFIRDRSDITGIGRAMRIVTVIVRDDTASSKPELVRLTAAFDSGP
jgi:Tfp pilus assembly protein PilV